MHIDSSDLFLTRIDEFMGQVEGTVGGAGGGKGA